MGREEDEAILRITAQYVAELHAGEQPDIPGYIARYPQYAEAIVDFLIYYHTIEVNVPAETDITPLADVSRIAWQRAYERVLPARSAHELPLTTLLHTSQQSFTPPQLASLLDVTADIVVVLERRLLNPSTIPHALFMKLAGVLQQPVSAIYTYFNLPGRTLKSELPGQTEKGLLRVAEQSMSYTEQLPEQQGHNKASGNAQLPDFRQILDESPFLSAEQKARWRTILTQEGL